MNCVDQGTEFVFKDLNLSSYQEGVVLDSSLPVGEAD